MADPTTQADFVYTELAPDSVFPALPLDLTGSDYQAPSQTGNSLYSEPESLDLADLTVEPEGDGSFDVIMESMKAHLGVEFDDNRITGEEYTKAYIALTTAALTTGMQFLLQKDSTFLQNKLLQMQARAAEYQAVAAAAQMEEQKQRAVMAQFDALNSRANFALTKMKLAEAEVSYKRVEKEIELVDKRLDQVIAETNMIDYRRQDILPEEKRQLTYQTDFVLPAQVKKTDYETDNIMPQQKANLEKDASIKDYQLSNTLVQQFKLLQEQTEVQFAQTQDTRIDGTTSVKGAIGKQKDLYSQQIDSYKKDARYKVGKMYLDAWITQKSLDEGLFAPDQLNNTNVNEVLANLRLDNLLGS